MFHIGDPHPVSLQQPDLLGGQEAKDLVLAKPIPSMGKAAASSAWQPFSCTGFGCEMRQQEVGNGWTRPRTGNHRQVKMVRKQTKCPFPLQGSLVASAACGYLEDALFDNAKH